MKLINNDLNLLENIDNAFNSMSMIKEIDTEAILIAKSKTIEWAEELLRPVSLKQKVVCAGIYNSGKSTLLNNLIAKEIFAVGDVPTTKSMDKYEADNIIYIDTPGLNANESDDIVAKESYGDADLIIFVSNAQNGGLNAAEANYLKSIINIIGDKDIFSKSILFTLSNIHQLTDELSVAKVIKVHKENIEKALDISVEKIFVYDALTYKNGMDTNTLENKKNGIKSFLNRTFQKQKYENAKILIEQSGLPQLVEYIQQKVKENQLLADENRNLKINIKDVEALNKIEYILQPIKNKLEGITADIDKILDKKQGLSNIKTKIYEEFKQFKQDNSEEPKFDAFEVNTIGLSFLENYIRNVEYKSEAKAIEGAKSNLSVEYNNREAEVKNVIRRVCNRLLQYTQYELSDVNYYNSKNIAATLLISNFAKQINTITNGMERLILEEIKIAPKIDEKIGYSLEDKLLEDVIKYDEYHSLDWYVKQNIEVRETMNYEQASKGAFFKMFDDGTRYTVDYCYYMDAVNEMKKDMVSVLNGNIASVYKNISPVINNFLINLIQEVNSKVNELNNIIDKTVEDIEKDIVCKKEEKDKILSLISPLQSFVELPGIYLQQKVNYEDTKTN